MDSSNNWIVILTSLLSCGILGVVIQGILDKRYYRFSQAFEFKQARYKAISILMLTAMNPNKYELQQLKRHRPDIESLKDLERELEMEYYNSMLFASQKVTSTLQEFLKEKNPVNYQKGCIRNAQRYLQIIHGHSGGEIDNTYSF